MKLNGCACCYAVRRAEIATQLFTRTTQATPRGDGQECCLLDDGRHVGDLVKEVKFPLVEVLGRA